MTVQRVTLSTDADGNEVAEETNMISSGSFASSADYKGPGVTVQDGLMTKTVTGADQLSGHEIITVQGMEIKVSQARELGLIDQVFDPSKVHAHQQEQAGLHPQVHQQAETPAQPRSEYQTADAAVDQMVADDTMSVAEAQAASSTIAEIEMSGMEITDFHQMVESVHSGEATAHDLGDDRFSMVQAMITKNTEATTIAAKAELGAESFAKLQEIAKISPEVNDAIRGYAMRRATGQAGNLTWTDLYNEAGALMRGL